MIDILKYFTFILTLMLHAYSLPNYTVKNQKNKVLKKGNTVFKEALITLLLTYIAKYMVKYLKFNLHSLFIAIASVSCVSKTKQNLIVNHTQ